MLPPEPSLVFALHHLLQASTGTKSTPARKKFMVDTGSLDIRAKSASITWRTGRSNKLAWIQNKVDAVQAPYRQQEFTKRDLNPTSPSLIPDTQPQRSALLYTVGQDRPMVSLPPEECEEGGALSWTNNTPSETTSHMQKIPT